MEQNFSTHRFLWISLPLRWTPHIKGLAADSQRKAQRSADLNSRGSPSPRTNSKMP